MLAAVKIYMMKIERKGHHYHNVHDRTDFTEFEILKLPKITKKNLVGPGNASLNHRVELTAECYPYLYLKSLCC